MTVWNGEMGILHCLQQTMWIWLIILNGLYVFAINVSEMNFCQTQNLTVTGQLHIKSPDFPDTWMGQSKCLCDIEGHDIVMATRTLVLSNASVLNVIHDYQGNASSWPTDNTATTYDLLNRKLVIARNASKITMSVDTTSSAPSKTFILFMFDFQAGEDITVLCQNLTTTHKEDERDTTDDSLLQQIGSVCSPHFVIILGSLCCALLLIILIISVILCCIVPKRSKYTIDYRNQQVTDEKSLRQADRDGRQSIIYDDAKVKINPRASAAYNNTLYAESQSNYSNTGGQLLQRSNTVPSSYNRQSALYANNVVT